jgi:hypothetical protein
LAYEIFAQVVPATAVELAGIAEQEAEDQALADAIQTIKATTTATVFKPGGRKRIGSSKAKENENQARRGGKKG